MPEESACHRLEQLNRLEELKQLNERANVQLEAAKAAHESLTKRLAADTDSFGLIGSAQNQSSSATVSFVKTSTTVIRIYVHDASGTNIDADVFLTIYEI